MVARICLRSLGDFFENSFELPCRKNAELENESKSRRNVCSIFSCVVRIVLSVNGIN